MNAQQLKKSILQMAVQGKLVPQDPNDEPASILLERIREDKEKLVKEGKIKKEKNPSIIFRGEDNLLYEKVGKNEPVCIVDEVPFEIPDSWEWVRLSDICTIVNGFTPLRSNSDYWDNGTIPWFTVEDIHTQGRRIKYTNQFISQNALSKDSNRVLPAHTVLLCCTASVGEYAITEIPLVTNQQFNGLVINACWKDHYSPEFLLLLVQTFKDRLLSVAGKTTFNFVSVKKLGNLLVPFLPYDEQLRIVNKFNTTVPHIKSYDEKEKCLSQLVNVFPEVLKKSILQQAVTGKLVPQDPNDEPVSVLLERICAEKEKLIKEGKLKKEKNPSILFRGEDGLLYEKVGKNEPVCIADEVPFEIPDTWAWVKLGNIAISELGKTLDKAKNTGEYRPYLCSINVYWSGINLTNVKQARFEDSELLKYRLLPGDLLICEGGDVGRSAVWNSETEMYYQNALHRVRFFGKINPYYFHIVLECYKGNKILDEHSKGMTIKHLVQSSLNSILFPLPPLSEQSRIVEKIEAVMPLCDRRR